MKLRLVVVTRYAFTHEVPLITPELLSLVGKLEGSDSVISVSENLMLVLSILEWPGNSSAPGMEKGQ